MASNEESFWHYHVGGGKEQKAARYRSHSRKHILKSRYGITEDDYNELFMNQGGRCAICSSDYSGSSRNMDVDHDHNTGQVRGLLCNNCNRGLGHFQDSSELLVKAACYLQSNPYLDGKGGSCGV